MQQKPRNTVAMESAIALQGRTSIMPVVSASSKRIGHNVNKTMPVVILPRGVGSIYLCSALMNLPFQRMEILLVQLMVNEIKNEFDCLLPLAHPVDHKTVNALSKALAGDFYACLR